MSLDPKPRQLTGKLKKLPPLFWLTVAIPTSCALLYYGVFASDVYVSESRFVVRSPDQPSVTGLGLLLKSTGFSTSSDKIFATKDFLESRDALQQLNKKNAFINVYTRPSISVLDRFDGFGFGNNFEDLFNYYLRQVKIEYDSTSSITTLTVRAFNPADAHNFNEQLLVMAEETVNRMSDRARKDLLDVAQFEVDQAQKKAQNAAVALSVYRNKEGIIDPEKQAGVQMQMISKLQDELITTRSQLVQLRAFAPANPQIPVLVTQEKALAHEIDKQFDQIAGSRQSLAGVAVQYERLSLESQFANKQLASALITLEEARSEGLRKKAYVERVVQPNLPDYPLEPRRVRGVFSTLILGLAAWGILSMLLAGMLEHRD